MFERADDFDIIHNGFDFLPLTYSDLVDTPVITTIHGFSSDRIVPVYERYDATTHYVAISDADRHPHLHYAATIHHGIDTAAFAVVTEPGDHLLYFGRIHPDKGTAHAIEVARRTGRRLDIAGIIQDERLLPHAGRTPPRRRHTSATSAPSPRPSAAPCSAMPTPCSTSSTSTNHSATASSRPWPAAPRSSPSASGSMPELIDHGATGYLVQPIDDAVDAVATPDRLDRDYIGSTAIDRFDVSRMIDQYVAAYTTVLSPTT